jgi:hypothetical protein
MQYGGKGRTRNETRIQCKYSVWLRTGRPGDRGSIPGRDKKIFPLASVSRPALRPTQLPVQRVPGVLSPGVKRGRGVTLTTHPYLVPRSRMSMGYTSSPPSASMACSGTALLLFSACVLRQTLLTSCGLLYAAPYCVHIEVTQKFLIWNSDTICWDTETCVEADKTDGQTGSISVTCEFQSDAYEHNGFQYADRTTLQSRQTAGNCYGDQTLIRKQFWNVQLLVLIRSIRQTTTEYLW